MTPPQHRGRVPAIALLLVTTLAGCGTSEPVRTSYVMGSDPRPQPVQSSLLGKPVVEVRPALLPDYLDTTDIITRKADGSVVASRTGRWGERLSVGMTQALALSLVARLPDLAGTSTRPENAPWRQVLVDVETFGVGPDGRSVLTAVWSVRAGRGDVVIAKQRTTLVEPVSAPDDAALVAAMSREADSLAALIAISVRSPDSTVAEPDDRSRIAPRMARSAARQRDAPADRETDR